MAEQKYTISDIIETYISGDWGNDEPTEDASCPVSCIRGADIVPIYNSEYNNIPLRYISEKSLSNKALQEGDIVIEKSGGSPTQSTGRVVYISKELLEEKQDIVCSNFCAAFRIKPEWDAKYVYYYLQHIYNAGVFFNFEGKTSGLKNLIMDTAFKSITIKKIAVETQRSIANILSTIESKMAANRAINHYLEAMAKQLYDYWFVQFDFPDANGKPYKSSGGKMVWNKKLKREIPEGWTLQPFSKYMNIFTGKKDVSKVTPGNHKFFSCAPDPITSNEYIYDGEAILVSGNGSYTGRVSYYNGKMDLYQRTYGCSPKSTYASIMPFMYYHMKLMFEPLNTGGKHGSSIPYIVLGDLADFFILEDVSVMKKFSELINPLFRTHMEYMAKSTELLQEYKDMILPLLMAGQVSVTPLNNDLYIC